MVYAAIFTCVVWRGLCSFGCIGLYVWIGFVYLVYFYIFLFVQMLLLFFYFFFYRHGLFLFIVGFALLVGQGSRTSACPGRHGTGPVENMVKELCGSVWGGLQSQTDIEIISPQRIGRKKSANTY